MQTLNMGIDELKDRGCDEKEVTTATATIPTSLTGEDSKVADQNNNSNSTENHSMNSRVNKQFNKLPENLRLNGRTPSGKPRLFVCQVCTRAFARQEHLTRHERSHTKEKPYCCGICNRKFSRRDLLLRHAHKIHGGNYGDTIIKQNDVKENGNNRVNKRRRGGSVTAANAVNAVNTVTASTSMTPTLPHSSPLLSIKGKRRASYSAQSGDYVAPAQNEQWHKADRVKFSTPELLPINMLDYDLSNDDKRATNFGGASGIGGDGNCDNNGFIGCIAPLDLNASSEFNMLDSNGWIYDYNNQNVTTSGSATAAGGPTPGDSPNSSSIEPGNSGIRFASIPENTGGLPRETADSGHFENNRSRKLSWTINEENGELQVKSLFMNRNNSAPLPRSIPNLAKSVDSPNRASINGSGAGGVRDSSIGSTTSAATQTTTRTTSTATTDDDWFPVANHTNSFSPSVAPLHATDGNSAAGALSEQLNRLEFEENGEGDLSNFAKDVQSIFGHFIQDEQSDIYNIPQQFSLASGNDENLMDPTIGSVNQSSTSANDNYTFYGLDYLTLSNISRASPSNFSNFEDLPPSKLFTNELRQICLHSLKYYSNHCNDVLGSDPVFISKDLILPSCSELNGYLSYFQKYFNPHTAFIHPDFFQLDLISLKYYINEGDMGNEEDSRYLQYSNIACLPLFVATVGSIYKPGCNSRTMELYEISRRVLHVYLERRKQQQRQQTADKTSIKEVLFENRQRIWLMQSLILSITFALFADYLERMDSEMIKRQVSAICSIIKGNFLKIISIDCHEFSSSDKNLTFDNPCDYIFFESKIRCTLMVYKICQFLKIFYRVGSKLFLNEKDLDPVCIPDDESTWLNSSLLVPSNSVKKKYTVDFQKFYHSFTFNNIGMHSIPECLSTAMLYYEFNASRFSPFHVFLTRIDTKKLERNQEQLSQLNPDSKIITAHDNLNRDSITLRNCLMSVVFLTRIDVTFGSKIWNGKLRELFTSFLDPSSINILTKGSYSLLTDFLVALNFSIKNVSHFLTLNENGTTIELDKANMSLFNCQGFYCNFLILIKFILDFERTPNFKLLCIFTELKKLANNLLIPKYSNLYPMEFVKFHDVSTTNNYLQNHPTLDSSGKFSTIDAHKLEKLINNVLVHAFNDASFLNMSEQPTNEFPFKNNHPTYYPYASPTAASFNPEEIHYKSPFSPTSNDNDFLPSKSSVDLLRYQNNNNSLGENVGGSKNTGNRESNVSKQGFAERYQLSDKYIVISKCFFTHVREIYAHCHIFKKMVADFQQLEDCVDEQRRKSNTFKMNQENGSTTTMTKNASSNSTVTVTKNQSSGDLINKFLQTQV
ncbi:hypothetical protein ZYGR_0AF03150 [Zygosaccharomyces rouxii]|uniref:C2H2-type domain-containing protein n=1 Tax=Zygosaccharomyces rouxii TaxID=4956 RepID=A0A1Q3A7Z3_ZYGRO|nr:hypothetical protein ZYGR_0AF03150 [Zygosaccharomyces rouxii]